MLLPLITLINHLNHWSSNIIFTSLSKFPGTTDSSFSLALATSNSHYGAEHHCIKSRLVFRCEPLDVVSILGLENTALSCLSHTVNPSMLGPPVREQHWPKSYIYESTRNWTKAFMSETRKLTQKVVRPAVRALSDKPQNVRVLPPPARTFENNAVQRQ